MLAFFAFVAAVGSAWLCFALRRMCRRLSNESHVIVGTSAGERHVPRSMRPCYFVSKATKLAIYYRKWPAKTQEGLADVFLLHGIGDHLGRYEHVAEALADAGYNVFALDQQGRGRSEGERFYFARFDHMVQDTIQFVDLVGSGLQGKSPRPHFLLGHSMGGLLAILVAACSQDRWAGLIITASALHVPVSFSPLAIRLLRWLSKHFPKLLVLPPGPPHLLSRDRAVVEAFQNDPLVHHGRRHVRVLEEVFDSMARALAFAPSLTIPCLCLHSKADRICLLSGSQAFIEAASSKDKRLVVYDHALHELYNEPEQEMAIKEVTTWLHQTLQSILGQKREGVPRASPSGGARRRLARSPRGAR